MCPDVISSFHIFQQGELHIGGCYNKKDFQLYAFICGYSTHALNIDLAKL